MLDRCLTVDWNGRRSRYELRWHDNRLSDDIVLSCVDVDRGLKSLLAVLDEVVLGVWGQIEGRVNLCDVENGVIVTSASSKNEDTKEKHHESKKIA